MNVTRLEEERSGTIGPKQLNLRFFLGRSRIGSKFRNNLMAARSNKDVKYSVLLEAVSISSLSLCGWFINGL